MTKILERCFLVLFTDLEIKNCDGIPQRKY